MLSDPLEPNARSVGRPPETQQRRKRAESKTNRCAWPCCAQNRTTRAKNKPWQETARKKKIGSWTRRLHARNEIEQQCSRSSGLFGTMPKPGERTKTAPDDNGLSTTYQKETAPCVDAML
jgi:hypothetical protein